MPISKEEGGKELTARGSLPEFGGPDLDRGTGRL
jgi:hypothetical protein